MTSENLKTLTERITSFRDLRNWKQFHLPKDMVVSLMLEASELLEHFQWKNGEELEKHLEEKKQEIGEELSDVLYWVLLLSHDLGIDLAAAFEAKMKRNEQKYPVEAAFGRHTKYNKLG